MEQSAVVALIVNEVERAVSISVAQVISGVAPGTVLLPWPLAIGIVGYALFDGLETFTKQLARIPVRVIAQLFAAQADEGDSTRVVRLDKARAFAAGIALGTTFELSGGIPPPGVHAAVRIGKIRGLKKTLIKLGQRVLLGPVLYRIFSIVRAPAGFAIRTAELLWNFIVIVLSIGACLVVWDLVDADWSKIALSQAHPRKRLRAKINKRL